MDKCLGRSVLPMVRNYCGAKHSRDLSFVVARTGEKTHGLQTPCKQPPLEGVVGKPVGVRLPFGTIATLKGNPG